MYSRLTIAFVRYFPPFTMALPKGQLSIVLPSDFIPGRR
jgi:hypothetical protein